MGKKKTLVILLLIPFVIGLLVFVSINVINITIASDIQDITWAYDAIEGFKIRNEGYKLEATPVINENLLLAPGNELTWYIREDNSKNKEVAKIEEKDDGFYFFTLNEGECEVVCSNVRGTKLKSFKAHVFENGSVIINTKRKESASKIDKTRYYGEHDLSYDSNKLKLDDYKFNTPKIEIVPTVYHDDGTKDQDVVVLNKSSNLTYDPTNKEISINGINKDNEGNIINSFITFGGAKDSFLEGTFEFKVIPEAINVYNYNDLLMATNFSSKGEAICLQTSLGSLRDVYNGKDVPIKGINAEQASKLGYVTFVPETKKENTEYELFGNYDEKKGTFNFESEIYEFETTYNHKYIDQVNKETGSKYSTKVKTGIRVQKDIYGNGYTINENNLAFPNHATIDKGIARLRPGVGDLFKGPLALVTIGPVEGEGSIVKAYGQDNSGMYIEGDNVTINDLKIRNIDDNVNRANFAFVGSVIDVAGDNVTIKNSIMSHGKNIIRAFDSDNLLIDNSILKTSGEFNLKVGNNEFLEVDENQKIDLTYNGQKAETDFKKFFNTILDQTSTSTVADIVLTDFVKGTYSNKKDTYDALLKMQTYLDSSNVKPNEFAASMNVNDTLFGDSGIFSVAFETMFNGNFLYNGYPSIVSGLLGTIGSAIPEKLGGTSKPVELTMKGNTKFYDRKKIDEIDINCLVEQAIKTFLEGIIGGDIDITIDDIFPMKTILRDQAHKLGFIYKSGDTEYINSEVAWYGGGLNYSKLNNEIISNSNTFSEEIIVDLLERSFSHSTGKQMVDMLCKCVLFAAGFNPFKFITNGAQEGTKPILDITAGPSVEDLITNRK